MYVSPTIIEIPRLDLSAEKRPHMHAYVHAYMTTGDPHQYRKLQHAIKIQYIIEGKELGRVISNGLH